MADLCAAALELADRSIPSFPCNEDKSPATARGFHDASLDPQPEDWRSAALVGVPTGDESGLAVLDVDPKAGGLAWLAANEHRLPVTRRVHTRSGGFHLYFRTAPGLRCSASAIAPGVDIRGNGGYVIAWDLSGYPVEHADDLAAWPEWLTAAAGSSRAQVTANRDAADLAPPSVVAVVALLEQFPNPADATRDDYVRVMMGAKGCIDGLSAAGKLEPLDEQAIADAAIAWACRWPGSPGYAAEEAKWESDFATRSAPLAGWRTLLTAAARFGVNTAGARAEGAADEFWAVSAPVSAPVPAAPEEEEPGAWKSMLQLTEKGFARANLLNARVALRHAPEWRGVLAHNVFADRVIMLAAPPWVARSAPFQPRALTDDDATRTAIFLQGEGVQVSAPVALEAAVSVALETPFDPVRSQIESVAWDGDARCDRWLIEHLGAEDTPLHRAFGAKFLLSAVARVIRPGCQVDTVLVLEGAQGIGKSSALRVLFGEWFTDHLPDLTSKDAALQLQGVWGLEFAELAALGRADAARVKEFISRRVDRMRRPFGKLAEDIPRRCVFAASVNPGGLGYLKDETGARRFWPVRCGLGWPADRKTDVAAFAAQVPQIWAEARARLAGGETWWLDAAPLEQAQRAATAGRFESDVWTEQVRLYLSSRTDAAPAEILCGALGKRVGDLTTADSQRLGRIMANEGWTRKQVRTDGGTREWRYMRGDSVVALRSNVTSAGPARPVTGGQSVTRADATKRSGATGAFVTGDSTSKGYPF